MVHPETEVNRESQRCSKLDKKKIVAKALRMDPPLETSKTPLHICNKWHELGAPTLLLNPWDG